MFVPVAVASRLIGHLVDQIHFVASQQVTGQLTTSQMRNTGLGHTGAQRLRPYGVYSSRQVPLSQFGFLRKEKVRLNA